MALPKYAGIDKINRDQDVNNTNKLQQKIYVSFAIQINFNFPSCIDQCINFLNGLSEAHKPIWKLSGPNSRAGPRRVYWAIIAKLFHDFLFSHYIMNCKITNTPTIIKTREKIVSRITFLQSSLIIFIK